MICLDEKIKCKTIDFKITVLWLKELFRGKNFKSYSKKYLKY